MPAVAVPVDALALGPGYIYWAPLATAVPANTVAGSVFTDTWATAGAWVCIGATSNGNEWTYDLAVDEVEVEEYLDPVKYVTSGRKTGIKFEMAQIHATNFKRALNGGTLATSGSGATLLSTLTPPALGAETRCMVGWESTDSTERMVATQCLQVGSITVKRAKGKDKATIPVEFRFEQPSGASTYPFTYYTAGTVRG